MNIRSLQNKLEDLQCFVKKEDCDVLLLTETWLKVNETFLYDIRNYKALHSCRDGRGGGASVYVKDTIRCCEINHLNDHFANIGANIVSDLENEITIVRPNGIDRSEEIASSSEMNIQPTNENEIKEIILDLKKNSAPGCDGITFRDIFNLKEKLLKILTKLINNVIATGIFPNELKTSKISPVFKEGSKKDVDNYRPISVLSIFSKIVEKLMKKRMLQYISDTHHVDEYQYGFLRNSSTLSTAVDFINEVSKTLDNRMIAVVVYIDLKKAFDVVSFDILVNKLKKIGFTGEMLNLIRTFIEGRKQFVSLDNVASEIKSNSYGVPQGSVLGPLLYSLYVLSLKNVKLKARYFTFADDTVLVYTGINENELCMEINSDLQKYVDWLYGNKLKININKTKYMVFKQKNKQVQNINIYINNTPLEQVSKIKYLGLVVDDKLSWTQHINKINDKIVAMISIIFKCRNYLTKRTKGMIYNAFFVSHFRYLLPVWGTCSKTNFDKVQILQNKVLKVLYNYERLTNSNKLYTELHTFNLSALLQIEQCKLIFKILNKQQKSNTVLILSNQVHNYETRIINNIYQINTRTNLGVYNPIVSASKAFNSLPRDIKNIKKFSAFVTKLKKHFLSSL
nr:unnamed protein product [Callosobruchus chinensis]